VGACLVLFALSGCNPEISQAKQKVRDLQKDPDAAQFRNVKECPTGFYVTGEVNGKNSYGAYAGFRTFYANSAGAHIVGDSEYADEDDYGKMCYDQAYKDSEIAKITKEAEEAVANASNAQ
jgi:hypothetical protein